MKAGKWDKKKFKGTELAGKTLGVIGYGRIGRTIGEKAKALGMQVMAYDPFVRHADVVPLDELLKNADVITLHLPHTPETHNILGPDQFAIMKPGVMVIQISRGGTVDEQALYNALLDGTVLLPDWMSIQKNHQNPSFCTIWWHYHRSWQHRTLVLRQLKRRRGSVTKSYNWQ